MRKADEIRLKFYLSDLDIYNYYFGNISTTIRYKSPLRKDDIPSLSFYYYKDVLYWKDFGLPTTVKHDAIGFVQELYGLSREEAIDLIWQEVVEDGNVSKSKKEQPKLDKVKAVFSAIEKSISFELDYFHKAYVGLNTLDFYKVGAVEKAMINEDVIFTSTPDDPAFLYKFDGDSFKTYRPLTKNKSKKFRGNKHGNVLEGYNQLPLKADHLIINKSLKDTMVLRNIGILSINPASEGSLRGLLSKVRELNARFQTIRIMFDPDPAGIKNAKILSGLTEWETIFLDHEKDCYDNVVKFGNYFWLNQFFSKFNLSYYGIRD